MDRDGVRRPAPRTIGNQATGFSLLLSVRKICSPGRRDRATATIAWSRRPGHAQDKGRTQAEDLSISARRGGCRTRRPRSQSFPTRASGKRQRPTASNWIQEARPGTSQGASQGRTWIRAHGGRNSDAARGEATAHLIGRAPGRQVWPEKGIEIASGIAPGPLQRNE